MNRYLKKIFNRVFILDALTVIDPNGDMHHFGDTKKNKNALAIRITTKQAEWAILRHPELAIGECFMNGTLVMEKGSIYDFLLYAMTCLQKATLPWWIRAMKSLQKINPWEWNNNQRRARRNAAHHYDLDNRFYSLFLDSDFQYSCAYYLHLDQDLESAQEAKKNHIAAKLLLADGQQILDIGSGWGGLGITLCKHANVNVTGITLSQEQLTISQKRAEQNHLEHRLNFRLQDYRKLHGTFDRIVSVGMFEHVGPRYYRQFFTKAAELLTDDGIMVLHSIGFVKSHKTINPWIEKYIFPGGYLPALSEVIPIIEQSNLIITDVEILRLHYAETLKEWRQRFLSQRDEAKELYDERFCNMWEFYLAASEANFRTGELIVFQIQLAKNIIAVPLTRDYLY